jgi:hypothetical protein
MINEPFLLDDTSARAAENPWDGPPEFYPFLMPAPDTFGDAIGTFMPGIIATAFNEPAGSPGIYQVGTPLGFYNGPTEISASNTTNQNSASYYKSYWAGVEANEYHPPDSSPYSDQAEAISILTKGRFL